MAIKKSLYFDNINLADYGVYITGEAVYNAPQRDVEVISIPGRNGDYIIDNGRFENIEITYPAGIYDDDQTKFSTRISQIRNILASRYGYVRIEDEYNPEEYRMGIFAGGLEVKPANGGIAGEFEIKFNCKPQRFLKSGETAVSVTSGDTLTNPTLFNSKPMLEVFGYGWLRVNGHQIDIQDTILGTITLADPQTGNNPKLPFSNAALNTGDGITLDASNYRLEFSTYKPVSAVSLSTSGALNITVASEYETGNEYIIIVVDVNQLAYINGTGKTDSAIINVNVTFTDNTTETSQIGFTVSYSVAQERIGVNAARTGSALKWLKGGIYSFGRLTGDSTKHSPGNPMFIDIETGNAYKIENDSYISLNQYIALPDPLPELAPGENEITYQNTITQFDVVPRWWKI